jgi:hypothetical protein
MRMFVLVYVVVCVLMVAGVGMVVRILVVMSMLMGMRMIVHMFMAVRVFMNMFVLVDFVVPLFVLVVMRMSVLCILLLFGHIRWPYPPLLPLVQIGHSRSLRLIASTCRTHHITSICLIFSCCPEISSRSTLPHSHWPNGSARASVAPQARQRACPGVSIISSVAPSTSVSRAHTSKQKRIASGITADSWPISSVTRITRAPFACSAQISTTLLAMLISCTTRLLEAALVRVGEYLQTLTDARQLLANQHIDNALPTEHRVQHDQAAWPLFNFTDRRCLAAQRMRAHCGQNPGGSM